MAVTRSNKQVLKSPSIDTADGSHTEINSIPGNDPPTLREFIEVQRTNTYCNQVCLYFGLPNTTFKYDKDGIFVRKAPIEGAIKKVVPTSLRTRTWNLTHYSLLASPAIRANAGCMNRWDENSIGPYRKWRLHNGQLLYGIPSHGYQFWSSDIIGIISTCRSSWISGHNILGPFLRTKAGSHFVVIMKDRCIKLARAKSTTKLTPTQIPNIFINAWISSYGIPNTVISDNGQQFASKFFTLLFLYLRATKLTTTAFHLQTNDQVEWYNKILVSRLRLYIADDHNNRDIFV